MEHGIELEALLRDAGWLRRLAGRLVGEGAADDLAQETWLAALRRPPRSVDERRPWLARVARNLAVNTRRGTARRVAREQEQHVERGEPTPDELAQAAEAQRLVAEAVTSLAPPLRAAIVLCYYSGLDSRTAAEELGVPASTLRTRLQRALEELRAELDRKRGRESWMMLLVPLASRENATVVSGLSGGVALTTMVLVATLAGGLAYVAWPDRAGVTREEPADLPELGVRTVAPHAEPRGEREPVAPPAGGSSRAQETAPTGVARLAGTLLVDGRPPEWPIGLRLMTDLGFLPAEGGARVPHASLQYREISVEARGAFAFEDLPLDWRGRLEILEFTLLDGESVLTLDAPVSDLAVNLTARPHIVGRLLQSSGKVASHTQLAYRYDLDGTDLSYSTTSTLADGRFRIFGGRHGERAQLALVAEGHARGWLQHETGPFARAAGLDLGDLVLEAVRARPVLVRGADGAPLEGACARLAVEHLPDLRGTCITDPSGLGTLWLPERPCPLRVSAFGFEDLLVTVEPADVLEFELTALARLIVLVPEVEMGLVRLRSSQALFVWDELGWDGPAQLFQQNAGASHWNTLRQGAGSRMWEYEYELDGTSELSFVGLVADQPFQLELFDRDGRSLAVQETRLSPGERAALTLGSSPDDGR